MVLDLWGFLFLDTGQNIENNEKVKTLSSIFSWRPDFSTAIFIACESQALEKVGKIDIYMEYIWRHFLGASEKFENVIFFCIFQPQYSKTLQVFHENVLFIF